MLNTGTSNHYSNWTMKLIIINVAIHLLQLMTMDNVSYLNIVAENGHVFRIERPSVIYYGGLTPYLVVAKGYVWQFFSYLFLHSPAGMIHIFFNMYALLLFGMPIEQLWGTKRFLIYYFFTGIGAGLVIFIINIIMQSATFYAPTIGASGAVFGLLLAFGMLFPDLKLLLFFFIPIKAKHLVILYGGLELMLQLFAGKYSNISHVGHLGGLFFGLLYFAYYRRKGLAFKGKILKAKLKKEDASAEASPFVKSSSKDISLETILQKLKTSGVDSLSDDEFQKIKYMDIMTTDNDNICVEEDFDLNDSYCDKCENVNACLMREIKKYLK